MMKRRRTKMISTVYLPADALSLATGRCTRAIPRRPQRVGHSYAGRMDLGDESTPRFRTRWGWPEERNKTNARSIYLQVTPWGMLNSAMPIWLREPTARG